MREPQRERTSLAPLPRAVGGTHRLDQRPVAVFLAVFADTELSEEHAGNLSRNTHLKQGSRFSLQPLFEYAGLTDQDLAKNSARK
jgi:hypothetical protein